MYGCIRDNVKGWLILAPLWSDTLMRRAFFVLQPYLTEVWKISFTHAAAIVNIWEGTSLMLPAVFQFLADKYFGNFKVVVFSTISSALGVGLVAMSIPSAIGIGTCHEYKKDQSTSGGAINFYQEPTPSNFSGLAPAPLPPPCNIVGEQNGLLYLGVALTAIGRGGLSVGVPCLHDEQSEGVTNCLCICVQRHVSTAENLFLYLIGTIIISVISSWNFRFGFPAIFAAAVALFFFGGWSVYKKPGPKRKGSLLSTVLKVFSTPRVRRNLRENEATPEESSFVRHITGISITFIILGIVSALSNTFFVEQADKMNRQFLFIKHLPLAAFQLPMLIAAVVWPCSCMVWTSLGLANDYGRPCIPKCLRIIPSILGISAALFHAALCCVVAAAVEKRRHRGLKDKEDMHAAWLIFQFYLVACVDIFFRSSIQSYYQTQAPSGLRGFNSIYTDFVSGLGYFSSVVLVAIVRMISGMGGKESWFKPSVNESRLDKYYWMLGIMGCLSLAAFCGMAPFSICKDVKPSSPERERETRGEDEDKQSICCFWRR